MPTFCTSSGATFARCGINAGRSPSSRTSSTLSLPVAASSRCTTPNCSYASVPLCPLRVFRSRPLFSTTCFTALLPTSYRNSDTGPLLSDRKYTASPIHTGCVSLLFSRGTFTRSSVFRSTTQIGSVCPPRYLFQLSACHCSHGVYARCVSSGDIDPSLALGSGNASGKPDPSACTRYIFKYVRTDSCMLIISRSLPSGVHPAR